MSKRKGQAVALIAAAILSSAVPVVAQADQYSDQVMGEDHVSGGAMVLDVLIARPVMVVGTAVGAAMFVASAPFSLAGGNVGNTWDVLVEVPAENAFMRCLGCTPVQHDRARADRQTELANMPKN